MMRRWLNLRLGAALVATGYLLAALVAVVLLTQDDGSDAARPMALATSTAVVPPLTTREPAGTPAPPPTATPISTFEPFQLTFEPGELIDVRPAVLFADASSGAATAWVFDALTLPEFGVAPGGGFIVYGRFLEAPRTGVEPQVEYRILTTADGVSRPIEASALPLEYGPGDEGFVAVLGSGSAVAVFDGKGEILFEVPLAGNLLAAAWSGPGELVAIANADPAPQDPVSYSLTIHRLPDGAQISLINDRLGGGSDPPFALEWSHGGQELAVVASNRVFIMQPRGARLWEVPGDVFWGNPRWSPNDSYLFVNGQPAHASGSPEPELSYVFDSQGVPLFRLVTAESGGCSGDPWLTDETFQLGTTVWNVEGLAIKQDVPSIRVYPDLSVMGFNVDPQSRFHLPHYGLSDVRRQLDDGRLVFTIPEIGHGGCGESTAGSFDGPIVQRPPFGAWAP